MYGHQCEYCEGIVQSQTVRSGAFKHRDGFLILENVAIGICNNCGDRYYSADILHVVHAVATGTQVPDRTEQIPVGHLRLV
jgi:YgiT-type zinc finger domain-containing protein